MSGRTVHQVADECDIRTDGEKIVINNKGCELRKYRAVR
jgi:hypothetical protein